MAKLFPRIRKPGTLTRRRVMQHLASAPLLGGLAAASLQRRGWCSYEERHLAARGETQPAPPATTVNMPRGKIGKLEISRMILGGNLLGGWAHARDLIYMSRLLKEYHTPEKIFETLQIAESHGVNTVLTNPVLCETINDYWRNTGGKIQFISDCAGGELLAMIKRSIDSGAHACYIQGGVGDKLVEKKDFDTIAKALDLIRGNGLPAGMGGHKLETITACVDQGIRPDFWMKTLHRGDYWSAKPEEKHDNIWCEKPDETIAYMKNLKEPWIAFKILAAGAFRPNAGFRYAFENGADFICVGAFDFQLAEDAELAAGILAKPFPRQREWRA